MCACAYVCCVRSQCVVRVLLLTEYKAWRWHRGRGSSQRCTIGNAAGWARAGREAGGLFALHTNPPTMHMTVLHSCSLLHYTHIHTHARAPTAQNLAQGGFTEDVWRLTNRKPAAKKSDWVDLMRQRSAAGRA